MTPTGNPVSLCTPRERFIIALVSLPIAAICILICKACASAFREFDGNAVHSFVSALFWGLFTEFFAAGAAFCLLAFAWAVFQPTWVYRFLVATGRNVWLFTCLLLLFFFVLAIAVTILK